MHPTQARCLAVVVMVVVVLSLLLLRFIALFHLYGCQCGRLHLVCGYNFGCIEIHKHLDACIINTTPTVLVAPLCVANKRKQLINFHIFIHIFCN